MKEWTNYLNGSSFIKEGLKSISPKIGRKTAFTYFLIILIYIVLTILLTYPVAFTIGTSVPGEGDAFQWMNGLWYMSFALSHPELTSLTQNNMMIFYPTGIPVMPFPSAFNQIITFILLPVFQIQVIYSFLWLLTFILAAFGTFLLVRYLTRNDYAAFLSGIIFAFTPFHLVHGLGHLGASTIQWIPFCALFFMKVFREGGLKNCILAGVFYVLVAMSDMQYLVFMGIFIAVLFFYEHFVCHQENKGFKFEAHKSILIKYIIIGIVAFSVIIPLTMVDLNVALSGNNYLKPNPMEAVTYSTDLLSFFLPPTLHSVYGNEVAPLYNNFTGNGTEHTTYIGYTVLILSIFALYIFRKDVMVRFWGIIAIFFSLLSLGPVLHVAGNTVFTVFKVSVPLPHLILYYLVPFLENSRTTGRFFIVAALAFAVLAGYGCCYLIKRYNTRKIIIVIIISALIIFEFICIPYPVSPVDQPEFYKEIGQDQGHYALLEIPITTNYKAGVKTIYYQTIHGKPVVGGQAARTPTNARDFEENTPFIRELTFFEKPQQDILNQNVSSLGNSVLQYYNIRYVVLHKDLLSKKQLDTIQTFIAGSNPTLPIFYEDETLVVYTQTKTNKNSLFMSCGPGWYWIENWTGTPTRWMSRDASVMVYSDNERATWLNFTATSFAKERNISISVNTQSAGSYQIATHFVNVSVPITIRQGMNYLSIVSPEGCDHPVDTALYKSADTRCLSIAVQNISIG